MSHREGKKRETSLVEGFATERAEGAERRPGCHLRSRFGKKVMSSGT